MLHELRIYRAMPGKLPALHQRFEEHTVKILKKHGIRPIGFWTTLIGESNQDITWMIEWDSLAEREAKWRALSMDPEWMDIKAKTEAEGALIEFQRNMILAPTAYAPSH